MDYSQLEEAYVNTSLGKLHILRNNNNYKTLLFLHGLGGDTKAWQRLVALLPDEYGIVLVDLLGHGLSDAPHIKYSASVQVSAIVELVEKEQLEQCNIVGHSYGGWVAALYASLNHPCSSIILIDSAGVYTPDQQPLSQEQREDIIKRLISTNDNKEYVMRSILESDGADALDQPTLDKIDKKTLIIWGENDTTTEKKYAIVLNTIKNSKLAIIDGAGHSPHYTHAEQVSKLILSFV